MSEKRKHSVPPSMTEQLNHVRSLSQLGPFFTVLDRFGISGGKLKVFASQMKEIEGKMTDLVHLTGSFNDVFLEIGWLLSESTNVKTAQEALKLHGSGHSHEAEALLAADYAGNRLDIKVRQWCHLEEFKTGGTIFMKLAH